MQLAKTDSIASNRVPILVFRNHLVQNEPDTWADHEHLPMSLLVLQQCLVKPHIDRRSVFVCNPLRTVRA